MPLDYIIIGLLASFNDLYIKFSNMLILCLVSFGAESAQLLILDEKFALKIRLFEGGENLIAFE